MTCKSLDIVKQVTVWVKLLPKENVLAWVGILTAPGTPEEYVEFNAKVAAALNKIVNLNLPLTEQEAVDVAEGIAKFTFLELPAELRSHN